MPRWFSRKHCGPIGVDIGSRSVKLVQFDAARAEVHEAARWDLPPEPANTPAEQDEQLAATIRLACEDRNFRGREAVLCLGADSLFVQNIRVAKAVDEDDMAKLVRCEAAGRLPFSSEEAEVRFIEADDVKQGDTVRREVVLLACHRPVLERLVSVAQRAGLSPAAIDIEPAAVLRCYRRQYRRDSDRQRRMMFVNVGASNTMAMIARGGDVMFVKYIDIGGRHFDEAVSRHLQLSHADAVILRRRDGDRRPEQRDPEIARGVDDAIRPTLDKLAHELSLCLRYYSVAFRGQPLSQILLGGGEAAEPLAQWLAVRLDMPCEVGDPLRPYEKREIAGRVGQWNVAAGLALREVG